jgi:hypothetical protein
MGNIMQDKVLHGDWSARVKNLYVVGPGSLKEEGSYDLLLDVAPCDAPEWLLAWCISQKTTKVSTVAPVAITERTLVPHGQIHGWMLSQAGSLRARGLGAGSIEVALLELVHKNCEPPIDESKVRTMAQSICNFPEGTPTQAIAMDDVVAPAPARDIPELDTSESGARPMFPLWAIKGTSIYDGLVAPTLENSSKHAEFIFVPAMQMMLNYLSHKVELGLSPANLNLFVGLISPYGQFFKSSSCTLAMDYFKFIGVLSSATKRIKSADDRVLVAQAGSPEGFGLMMQKMDSTHAILFNDELGKFVSKAGIESSSFSSDLLVWYGSGEFGNSTVQLTKRFLFEAGTYTFGWLWATTDRGFNRHWPKLAGISSGLQDRMFFVISPEKAKPTAPYSNPDLMNAALTKQLIDRAIMKKTFEFEDPEDYARRVSGLDPRSMDMVKILSLYFCIDMGADIIDSDHIERAMALVTYRNQAAAFLAPIESESKEGRLQQEILRELRQNKGKLSYRELCRSLNFGHVGMFEWSRAYKGLITERLTVEFNEQRTVGKRQTRMVGLRKWDDDD